MHISTVERCNIVKSGIAGFFDDQGAFTGLGTFLQNIMLAARGFGLETRPQAAWANHHETVRRELPLGEDEMVMCGMSMRHFDPTAAANSLRTDREAVETFIQCLSIQAAQNNLR